MAASFVLRGARHLSSAAATASATKPITISYTKNKLKKTQDPDEALKIYASFTAADSASGNPVALRYALESTVRLLSKSRRFAEIESFLESHKSLPQITQEPFISSLIRSYGVARMFENALSTYKQMSDFGTPRSSLSFNALLYACLNSKLFDRLPVYFDELPSEFGFSPDKFSYGILVKSFCEMDSPEAAVNKLNEMEEKGIELSVITFTPILHALYKKGRIDEAVKFWDYIVTKKGLSPDVAAYNVRLMNEQGLEGAKALMEEMSKLGIKPDTISYNYLMACYCENGMMDEAKKVYDGLKEQNCRPNAATFRILVFHLCKSERFVTGYKVFKESVKLHKIPDFSTLKHLMGGLVKKGHLKQAKGMVRTVNKKFPPNLLKAWEKLVKDLGIAVDGAEEVASTQEEPPLNPDKINRT